MLAGNCVILDADVPLLSTVDDGRDQIFFWKSIVVYGLDGRGSGSGRGGRLTAVILRQALCWVSRKHQLSVVVANGSGDADLKILLFLTAVSRTLEVVIHHQSRC